VIALFCISPKLSDSWNILKLPHTYSSTQKTHSCVLVAITFTWSHRSVLLYLHCLPSFGKVFDL